ncbi:MAG: transketolase C-terminal domain-containing protein [Candidatus Omnitrophica bacterium]|nr:transketolase C-terminal domain-containing protein [Candidatus Omnitrophota bacterium]MDD5575106.1 transketolase C-terminal domain-containing protein [Candidatus Omnitrophota bacterium]
MRKQFRDTVLDLAKTDKKIVMVFGDVSVYLFAEFQASYPSRFYNIGICENTLISLGAGLSSQGFIPFVHTINPFITERSYEQIKLDLCYNGFGANLISCGASFDYAWDGATHHAYTDMAILRLLPDIEVIQPGSRKELDILLRSQYGNGKVTYFRLSDHPHTIELPVEFGRAVVLKEGGSKVTVMTAGPMLENVLEACRDLDVNVVYFHAIKPIDQDAIRRFRHTKILVVHDAFGLYEAICEVPDVSVTYYGLPDKFCSWYGTLHDIRKRVGLDSFAIRERIRRKIQES